MYNVWFIIPGMWLCDESGIMEFPGPASAELWVRDNLGLDSSFYSVYHNPHPPSE